MASMRTEITEIATALGVSGSKSLKTAIARQPSALTNVDNATWKRITKAYRSGQHDDDFETAFANGHVFFASREGLRERKPLTIEWKGHHQAPGFDHLPVDLRVDHVYLISCKHHSGVMSNSSPSRLFDHLLADRTGPPSSTSWFEECAPKRYASFYEALRRELGIKGLPRSARSLTPDQKDQIRAKCGGSWPEVVQGEWRSLSNAVARRSATRWRKALGESRPKREEMVWRLLRMNPGPYFLLGANSAGPLQLRVQTPWDWRQDYRLKRFEIEPLEADQAKVAWTASVVGRDEASDRSAIKGHIEVRWSHGRFSAVEAKVYLDTPLDHVPGYTPLR